MQKVLKKRKYEEKVFFSCVSCIGAEIWDETCHCKDTLIKWPPLDSCFSYEGVLIAL